MHSTSHWSAARGVLLAGLLLAAVAPGSNAAKTLADPDEPVSTLPCTCSDIDPRPYFTAPGYMATLIAPHDKAVEDGLKSLGQRGLLQSSGRSVRLQRRLQAQQLCAAARGAARARHQGPVDRPLHARLAKGGLRAEHHANLASAQHFGTASKKQASGGRVAMEEPRTPRKPHELSDAVDVPREVLAARSRLSGMHAYHADDFDVAESDLHRELLLSSTKKQYALEQAMAWVISLLIGLVNGCLGAALNLSISFLNTLKFNTVAKFISPGGGWVVPFLVLNAFAVAYGLVAGAMGSFLSPQAAGSGIPDIQAYLNGIKIPNLLTIRTLVAKSVGVCFAIASGLVAGKEGPFIHIGAIIGGGVSSLGSRSVTRWTGGKLQAQLRRRLGVYFRQPVEHRDYVAAGTAAGISTAFGAPIGGILFAVEQGSSWFSTRMLWHAVLGAGVALYVTVLLMGSNQYADGLLHAPLGSPLDFVLVPGQLFASRPYFYLSWELAIHGLMGVVGGLLGALLSRLSVALTSWRVRYVPRTKPLRRMLEVVFYAVLTSSLWFLISVTSPCEPRPVSLTLSGSPGSALDGGGEVLQGAEQRAVGGRQPSFPRLWCEAENSFSSRGVLFMTPLTSALAHLYHSFNDSGSEPVLYSNSAMGLLFFLILALIPTTYGMGAASGVFVPTLVAGAAGGRLVGKAVRSVLHAHGVGPAVVPLSIQSYAVVGSAALLGGVSRMLLSSCVLIIETSGAQDLTVPLIITSVIAKVVADALTPGLYDTTLTRACYPFLAEEPQGLHHLKLSQQLTVADVMSQAPVTLPVLIRIRDLVAFLRFHPFNTFPLTAPDTAVLMQQLQYAAQGGSERARQAVLRGQGMAQNGSNKDKENGIGQPAPQLPPPPLKQQQQQQQQQDRSFHSQTEAGRPSIASPGLGHCSALEALWPAAAALHANPSRHPAPSRLASQSLPPTPTY
ncbi:chloride channel, partial [Haematococcus lacustris]